MFVFWVFLGVFLGGVGDWGVSRKNKDCATPERPIHKQTTCPVENIIDDPCTKRTVTYMTSFL